jgi:hypothetical protein
LWRTGSGNLVPADMFGLDFRWRAELIYSIEGVFAAALLASLAFTLNDGSSTPAGAAAGRVQLACAEVRSGIGTSETPAENLDCDGGGAR